MPAQTAQQAASNLAYVLSRTQGIAGADFISTARDNGDGTISIVHQNGEKFTLTVTAA